MSTHPTCLVHADSGPPAPVPFGFRGIADEGRIGGRLSSDATAGSTGLVAVTGARGLVSSGSGRAAICLIGTSPSVSNVNFRGSVFPERGASNPEPFRSGSAGASPFRASGVSSDRFAGAGFSITCSCAAGDGAIFRSGLAWAGEMIAARGASRALSTAAIAVGRSEFVGALRLGRSLTLPADLAFPGKFADRVLRLRELIPDRLRRSGRSYWINSCCRLIGSAEELSRQKSCRTQCRSQELLAPKRTDARQRRLTWSCPPLPHVPHASAQSVHRSLRHDNSRLVTRPGSRWA